ncbi:MAG: ECF-type sigma factor [Phycisphaerales bacterium]
MPDPRDHSAGSPPKGIAADHRLTLLLERAVAGDAAATNEILPIVYDELRSMAAAYMSRERSGQTLQPTALVHEAYLRLFRVGDPGEDKFLGRDPGHEAPGGDGAIVARTTRAYFFGAAAQAMRRILVERARARGRIRHGAGRIRFDIADADVAADAGLAAEPEDDSILAIDELLDRLAAQDPVKSQVVMLRYFTGLTLEQTADTLGLSFAEVRTRWAQSRAWMHRELAQMERA